MHFPPLLIAWLVLLAVLLIGHLIRQWRIRRRRRVLTLTFLIVGNPRPLIDALDRAQASLKKLNRR